MKSSPSYPSSKGEGWCCSAKPSFRFFHINKSSLLKYFSCPLPLSASGRLVESGRGDELFTLLAHEEPSVQVSPTLRSGCRHLSSACTQWKLIRITKAGNKKN